MIRLGGVASKTYLVAFPAIKKHFQKQGIDLDWVLYASWDALVDAFVRREVDLAWNGPLAYLKIKRRLDHPCQVVAMRDVDLNLVTHFITQPGRPLSSAATRFARPRGTPSTRWWTAFSTATTSPLLRALRHLARLGLSNQQTISRRVRKTR